MWKSVFAICLVGVCGLVFATGGAVSSVVDDIDIMPDVQMCSPVIYEVEYIPPVDEFREYMSELEDSIIRSDRVEGWDCVDYSLDFAKVNCDWGVVTTSRAHDFCPKSHMVNYQIFKNDTLIVYDGLLDNVYHITGWQWDSDYYHFWLDGERPVREYEELTDNRGDVI